MVTATLVQRLIDSKYEDLPEQTLIEAKRSLLNWLGVAIGAAWHPSMDMVMGLADTVGGKAQATVLGRGVKTDILFAALLNGMSSHIFDFDDTLLETVLHPSAPVYPAILSYAELKGLTGKDVLQAFVLGCEVEERLALSLYPSHYWRGWHITGTVGTVGAAAAIAKLQGLDHLRFSYAIGLAATEPTGLREMFGTMTKPFHPGKAAMNGLMAALLAESGFTSSTQSLEAKRGYGHVLSEEPKFERVTDRWGETWEILKNSYKPFASGIVTHPAIDGAVRIRNKHSILPEQVASIELEVHPLVEELTGKTNPQTGLEGKFSVYHCTAVGLIDGKAGVKQFSDERVKDERVVALRDKIRLSVNREMQEDQALIRATLNDGRVIEEFIEHAIGSMDVPMTNAQLEEKFYDVTADVLPADKQKQLVELVWEFDKLEDLSQFFALCSK
ncbi:MmgE/PrpD family protein [Ferviditalea candida]|uniref:MmgE/PrpD family protein n=1 Tax=Ferviditalea candida TaxID=3108399 RepID=A0ABU5ZM60_9BACL|nr:MmgE/PrpD family protein [Paenibacillaceae bacterium T2]